MSEPKRYTPYIAFENMAYPFPAMREVNANWKQYVDVKMAYVTDADYARLKAKVERLEKLSWQPIETAPMDGSSVLVYLSNAIDTSWAQVAHWSEECQCWCEWDHDADQPLRGLEITHWMPYPDRPKNP